MFVYVSDKFVKCVKFLYVYREVCFVFLSSVMIKPMMFKAENKYLK